MAIVKLRAGETVLVSAVDQNLKPDQGLPSGPDLGLGTPSHPIILPGDPTHPIAKPPQPGTPTHPIAGQPSHPITLPPPGEIPPPIEGGTTPNWELKTAWTPVTGWVVVAVPGGAHATPSKK